MPASQQRQSPRAHQPGARSASTTASKPSYISSLPTFSIPPALKRIFDSFPTLIYPENPLPVASPRVQHPDFEQQNTLFVWSSDADAASGSPSFNPTCLQAQTYLQFLQVPFVLCSANNHASPSGSLPHLFPPRQRWVHETPIRNSALPAWARAHGDLPAPKHQTARQVDAEAIDPIHDVLASAVRPAYINALYLDEQTFREVAFPRYVAPASRSGLVRFQLGLELRRAAHAELATLASAIRPGGHDLTAAAAAGLQLLAARLGQREWFSSQAGSQGDEAHAVPGMLDAAVFAYTHIIVSLFAEQHEHSPAAALREQVLRHDNLVQHHRRIIERYYG